MSRMRRTRGESYPLILGRSVPGVLLAPGHRIIRGNGALGGYRWGLARKRWLLQQEGVLRSPESDGPAILDMRKIAFHERQGHLSMPSLY